VALPPIIRCHLSGAALVATSGWITNDTGRAGNPRPLNRGDGDAFLLGLKRRGTAPRKSGFVGSVRAALHVIDEGSQLRHHLMAAGIVEKYTRRGWRERLQDVYEPSRLCRSGSDRCRHLRKTHPTFAAAQIAGLPVTSAKTFAARLI
jgi:hypothetical protein